MKHPGIRLVLLLLTGAACIGCTTRTVKVRKYFDILGFIDNEVEMLRKSSQEILKTVDWNGQMQRQIMPASEMNWSEEFAWLKELDINKPAYLDIYEVDSASNLNLEVSYTLKQEARSPVKFIHIINNDSSGISFLGQIIKEDFMSKTTIHIHYSSGGICTISGSQLFKLTGVYNSFSVNLRPAS